MLVPKIEVSPFFVILEMTVFCLCTFSSRKAEVSLNYGLSISRSSKEAQAPLWSTALLLRCAACTGFCDWDDHSTNGVGRLHEHRPVPH